MARAKLVFAAQEHPGPDNEAHRQHLERFFDRLAPLFGQRAIPSEAAGFAIIARAPGLAVPLAEASAYMVEQCDWTTQHADLRELSIQVLNLHFRCDFNFQSHLGKAERLYGLPAELQAAIPLWETTSLFSPEQRLVIEYTLACVNGTVTDALFERVGARFGETGAVEMTMAVAWWSFWAVLVGAIAPQHDFGYRPAPA